MIPAKQNGPGSVRVVEANLSLTAHQEAVVAMIDAYARDPLGDGAPLDDDVKARLVAGLRAHPTTIVFLAFEADEPVGVAVCFLGFSTFAARPLINIHDFAVIPSHRGRGISRQLLGAIEAKARAIGCCKLTLEVLENNRRARHVYETFGFTRYQLQPEAGGALFLSKPL
ncbi:MAG TPA: GNAT family N-acetyltransferase [Opitutaceae bacterium]|nr:GNAT family N-acetyltransferase [Opitutaceae bacterium]